MNTAIINADHGVKRFALDSVSTCMGIRSKEQIVALICSEPQAATRRSLKKIQARASRPPVRHADHNDVQLAWS
jgi:hypothetical protein